MQEAEREGDSSLDGQAHWKGGPSGRFESDVRAGRSGSAGPGVIYLYAVNLPYPPEISRVMSL